MFRSTKLDDRQVFEEYILIKGALEINGRQSVFQVSEMELVDYERLRSCFLINCGFVNEHFPTQIQQIERIAEVVIDERKLRKRVVFVAIESIQNVTRHGIIKGSAVKPKFILGKTEAGIFVLVSNAIKNNQVPDLTRQLETVKRLSKDELQGFIINKLKRGEILPNEGAGIGLHCMALKSNGGLQYAIRSCGPLHSCFTLRVDFTKTE